MLTDDKELYELIAQSKSVTQLMRLTRLNGMKLTRGVAVRLFASVHSVQEEVPSPPSAPSQE